jgi:hypothetical protein
VSGETAVLVSVYSNTPTTIKGDIHLYVTPETGPGNFHHIICLPFIGANSYLWLYGKSSLSFTFFGIGNGYGVLTGSAFRDENKALKFTIRVGFVITALYIFLHIIILYSNVLSISKVNASNLNLSADYTLLRV